MTVMLEAVRVLLTLIAEAVNEFVMVSFVAFIDVAFIVLITVRLEAVILPEESIIAPLNVDGPFIVRLEAVTLLKMPFRNPPKNN